MSADSPGLVAVVVALVVLAAVLTTIEAALSSFSRARAVELAQEQRPGAVSLLRLLDDPAHHLNALLVLRLLAETSAVVLSTAMVLDLLGPQQWSSVLAAIGLMFLMLFVVVGVGPRTIGRQHAYAVGRFAAPLVLWLGRALGPLATLLIRIGNAVTPGVGFREGPFATQVELRELVDLAEQRGVVEHDERDMIHSVFALGDTIAREVMVPRTEMVWINAGKSASQALTLALRSGFSRLPVVGETVDDVLGVVYLKDLVGRAQNTDPDVASLMRTASYVPESKHVDELLREMQAARTHMAIVVDEYGGTAGLVTIEDILEEIVGEITDEYDVERPPVERLDEGRIRVSARLPVEDLGELFGVDLDTDEVETVAGLMAQALGRVPIPGATAVVNGLTLVAEGTTGRRNRIDAVLVARESDEHDEQPHEERQTADA